MNTPKLTEAQRARLQAKVKQVFKCGPEAKARFLSSHAKECEASRLDLIKRLTERYKAETDPEYKETMWGDSLRRYGVDTSAL